MVLQTPYCQIKPAPTTHQLYCAGFQLPNHYFESHSREIPLEVDARRPGGGSCDLTRWEIDDIIKGWSIDCC